MNKKKKIGIIFGPNGAGKGTLAERLCIEYDYAYLNMGQTIREWINKDLEKNRHLRKEINNGNLIDDTVVEEALREKFESIHKSKHKDMVFDGLPRRRTQVAFIKDLCEKYDYSIEWIIVLSISLEEVLERVSQRVVAPDGTVYHYKFNPPPAEIDPKTLKHRKDDRPAIVKKRYNELMINSLDCLSHPFFKDVKVANIDASESIEQVFDEACAFLGHYKKL